MKFTAAPSVVLYATALFCTNALARPEIDPASQPKTLTPDTVSVPLSAAPISSTNQIHVLPLTNVLPPQFVRIAPYGSPPISSDYCNEVLAATKGRVLRFKNMPVKVYITPCSEPGFTEACIRGFDEWENRTNGLVAFLRVDDPEQARVRVVWKRMGHKGNSKDCMLGAQTITRWQARRSTPMGVIPVSGIPVPIMIPRIGPQYSVEPQIIEVNLDLVYSRDRDIRLLVLKNVVTHELGHALGLLGHSPMRADLMYTETDEASRLSQRDINTIKRLYQMKVDIPL
ncbi:MAG: matrixin family metalloprotease [Candidatus Melainabacteria bacterium]|nr:matrixin family metalloprotease [Candidatus Melainabacteria bacterium]